MRIANEPELREELRKNLGWAIALGVLIALLGVLALARPLFATLAATLIFGWLFVIGGVLRIVYAFQTRKSGQFWLKTLVGILSLVAGILLVTNLLEGVLTLTLILGIAIFLQGAIQTILAFQLRPAPNWGMVLLGGILSIILGILIWSQWPFNAPWVIGVLVGIALIFDGVWIAMFSMSTRQLLQDEST
ncbi:HdeD family acid-resistance protein [Baaleninema simplex]|uniref:HdeD family acid-resistance protein n=1 Tax=Baaleninema simplex TaxID=2862350 RepID=UPI000347C5E6|nr:HdeD family acid-resistance protein [Baaleninema simplex]